MTEYRVAKGVRELPCCGKSMRVKIVEPGVQKRHCKRHDMTHYFELIESAVMEGTLRMVWVDEARYREWLDEQASDPALADINIADL